MILGIIFLAVILVLIYIFVGAWLVALILILAIIGYFVIRFIAKRV